MEILREIFASISHSKSRFILTGISVGWGIFLLIVLLGLGNGISNGISATWIDENSNKIVLEPKETMLAWGGQAAGRKITFSEDDARALTEVFADYIESGIPEIDTTVLVSYLNHFSRTDISGLYPGYRKLRAISIAAGRDINDLDIKQMRKVCVLSTNLTARLFPGMEPAEIVGKTVSIFDVAFTVVGVYKPNKSYNITKTIIAPFSTVQSLYFRENKLSKFSMVASGLDTKAANAEFSEKLQNYLATTKNYSPADKRAITISNTVDYYLELNNLFGTIRIFLWIVGIATLVAGVIGISNIMLITVKERTRELAVRKAMGASAAQIISLVLLEAVFVTVIFGYMGMMLGIGVLETASHIAATVTEGSQTIFVNPGVDLGVVLGANIIMIISGIAAGYVPAQTAVRIKLVEALASND